MKVYASSFTEQSSYILPAFGMVNGYFFELYAKVSSDAGLSHVRKLNRLFPCPNPKARRFYEFED